MKTLYLDICFDGPDMGDLVVMGNMAVKVEILIRKAYGRPYSKDWVPDDADGWDIETLSVWFLGQWAQVFNPFYPSNWQTSDKLPLNDGLWKALMDKVTPMIEVELKKLEEV